MERSKTQRSLADQYLDQHFTPGKYSRHKVNQQKFSSKQQQKQSGKRQNRFQKNKIQATSNQSQIKILNQLDKMNISQQCRKILMKMQRFDRYLYPILSQKQFKQSIDLQMKRLEKVKNQKKLLREKTFDSQLLIIALYNHIKLVVQMNRQLQDRQNFKSEVRQLQKKVHQIRNDAKKQLKQGKIKGNETQTIDLANQEIDSIKKIITLLQNQNSDQAQNQLKNFAFKFGKTHLDLGRLCQLFRNYIYDYKKYQSFINQSSIQKLSVSMDQITQFLSLNKIDSLRKMFDKLKKQQIRDHAQQKIYKFLATIIDRISENKNIYEKQIDKSQVQQKSSEKKEIHRINKSQSSKNRQYQKQINKLKIDLENATKQQKKLEYLLNQKDKQQKFAKKQIKNISEGQNTTTRDQIIIGLQNDIQALQKDIHRLQQDNRTKTLKIHNLTKHNKQLEKKVTISQEKYPIKKSIDKSIKSQKDNQQYQQLLDKIIKSIGNKQQRDKLLIQVKKKGFKNKFYMLLDAIIKNQKNFEIKSNKLQEDNQLTKQHLNALLSLLESQSQQHWWTNRNPIPNSNNFKNGSHSVLINKVIQIIKQVYKIWSATQNQNNSLKRDVSDYKDQAQVLKMIKAQSNQIKIALKSIQRKFSRVKQDVWDRPVSLQQIIAQQFSKKQLKQLLSIRQDFQEFIIFILQQMKGTTSSKEKIQSNRSIKSVTSNKTIQIHQNHLDSINQFSEKVTYKINNGQSWEKDILEIRKSMPRTPFLNFIQAIQKHERALIAKITKINDSESSAKEHLHSVIDLLQSQSKWWNDKNPVSLNYKTNALSQYIYKITDQIKNLHKMIDNLQKKEKQIDFVSSRITQSDKDLKGDINYVTQTIKNLIKKASNLKKQICEDQNYLSNVLKVDISVGKRSMKQVDLLLIQIYNLLFLAADAYISNHNEIINKVDQKTLKLQQQIKDHLKEVKQLQQSLIASNNKFKKSENLKQSQNLTFTGQIKKLKNTIQNLLNQQKNNQRQIYENQKNNNDLQKKYDEKGQQNKTLTRENQRMKRQIQKSQTDLQEFKQRQKNWKLTELENQNITRQLANVRQQLQSMSIKVSDFYKSKESLALNKHNAQIEYQNSIAQLEMLNKITQQKLQYSQKKKGQTSKQITKKEQQLKFQIDARNKDKSFYDKMKLKLENQITQLSDQLQTQRRQSNKIISQLNLQKNQLRKDFQIEQNSLKQRINQLQFQIQRNITVDRDLLSFKRQVQKLQIQLSQNQNNYRVQTDQLRKYIAKMNADMQTLIIIKDQQKRVLRQQIQIARQQEINKHYEKIRILQQQNRNLKQQQSRLIYIVESNENNFNALAQENKILYYQIQELKKKNENNFSDRFKQDNQKIILLENKLKMFQSMIDSKNDTQQYQNALKIIDQVNKENKGLKDKLSQFQFRQIENHNLNLNRVAQQNENFMESFAKYQKLLTENAEIKSNLSLLQRQLIQFQYEKDKLKRKYDGQLINKDQQVANLSRKLKIIQQQKEKIEKHWNQSKYNIEQLNRNNHNLRLELSEIIEQFNKTKNLYQQQHKKFQTYLISSIPISKNQSNEDFATKVQFYQLLINQKQKQLQNFKKTEHNLRALLQQKNSRIEKLMSQNYSVRLTINEKDKIIQTNEALAKVQRQKVLTQNNNLLIVNTRLQQQFNKRQLSYRNDIDKLRENFIKLQDEIRASKQNSRQIQFELQQSKKQQYLYSQSINSSNVRGYQENLQKFILDNNQFRSQIGILQLSIKHKDEQIQEIKEKLNNLKLRLNQKIIQNQEKARINNDLRSQIKQLSMQSQMKNNMTQFQKRNLESSLQDLQRQKRNLYNQIDQLRKNTNQKIYLENEVQKLKKCLNQAQNNLSNQNTKIQILEKQNKTFIIEKQNKTSDFTNPQRQIDRMTNQISSLKKQERNLKDLLQKKQQQIIQIKNQLIEMQFNYKQLSQTNKFQRLALQQQFSLFKSQYDTLNNKYQREKDELLFKQSQLQMKLQNYQFSNESQLIHTKKQLQDEKRQYLILKGQIEKLKNKNTQLLQLNKQIKEINQQSIKKLHKSVNDNQQLQISYKANQQIVQQVNKKLHVLSQQNQKLRNQSYIKFNNSQSSYQALLIKIKQLQSRHLNQQDIIYKLQHQNRRIINQKIMMDLQIKRLSRQIQNKNDQIIKLKQNSSKNIQQRKTLSQKVQDYQQHNRRQNTHLKKIISMLDEGYLVNINDLTQVQILLKVSMEIQHLIKTNRRLQINNRYLLQQRQRNRYGINAKIISKSDTIIFGKQLIDTLFQFLFERGILTPQDISLFRNKRKQSQFISYQNQAQFFEQLQQILKNIFELMIDTQRRHIEVHRNVLKDIKYLMEDFFKSRNQQFLITIKKSLQSSLQ